MPWTQAAIKSTNEPPEGLKANLIRAWTMFNDEMFENSSKQAEFRSICFGLAFFHGTIIERKKFGPQGWNRVYPFNTGDLTSSAQVGATVHVPPAHARGHTRVHARRAHTHVFTRTRAHATLRALLRQVAANYLESNPKIPWDDLRYIFGEIMYGGHITDDWDRRLCNAYLRKYCVHEILEGLELCPGCAAAQTPASA